MNLKALFNSAQVMQTRAFFASTAGKMFALIAFVCLWSFWPTLGAMAEKWSSDPQYSHGFLVPLFAAVVLWSRRDMLTAVRIEPSWWGLAFLVPALASRLLGASMDVDFADAVSLLPMLAGVVLLAGGWRLFQWSWPAIAFLGFMVPLPFQLETALGYPLRRFATICTTYILQTLGFPALAEGNIILIDQLRLGVIDACSGLGMLVTFFALATAMAMIIEAPLMDRLVIVASAVPIAILANIVRITATAIAHHWFGSDVANAIMHDLAGWLMMPLALGIMWLELRFLARLFIPVEESEPLALGLPGLALPGLARSNGRGPVPLKPLPLRSDPSVKDAATTRTGD